MYALLPARSRPASPPSARRPASAGCATSACSSTTPTRCSPPRRPRTRRTSTRRSCRCSSTPTTRRCRPRRPRQGIPADWIDAASRSPVYALAVRHKVALPLHPEYRTLPMVWYIPPLSPVADMVHAAGYDDADPDRVFATIDALRIPVEYLANLFTAGNAETVSRCCASSPRSGPSSVPGDSGSARTSGLPATGGMPARTTSTTCTGCSPSPSTRTAMSSRLRTPRTPGLMGQHEQLFCSLDGEGGPGMGGNGPPGATASRGLPPGRRRRRQRTFRADDGRVHFNLLGWNGRGSSPHLFPDRGRREPPARQDGGRMNSPYKLASVLLQYPTTALFAGLDRARRRRRRAPRRRPPGRRSGGSSPGCARHRRPRWRSTTCRPSTCAAAARCT